MNVTKTELRDNNKWVKDIIDRLSDPRFYGKVTVSFEAGRAVLARKEETIKPI